MKVHFRQSNGYTYSYRAPTFLKGYNESTLVSLNYDSISSNGQSTDASFRKAIMGSIGEAFERQTLINFYRENIDNVQCLQLVNNEIINYPMTADVKKFFYDSCGLATHVTTKLCIESALKEFIERQSFIFSYLSKTPKHILSKNMLFHSIIPKYFDFMNFYEISLVESYKVVFCIGQRTSSTIDIGLGAGYSIEEALRNVLKEILPLREDPISSGEEQEVNSNIDYIDIFNKIPRYKIINAYDYLNGGSYINPVEKRSKSREEVILDLQKNCKMAPKMCTMVVHNNNFFRNHSAKSIKIFDFNWFPSLNVNDYSENVYITVEKIMGQKLDRDINFIPFP